MLSVTEYILEEMMDHEAINTRGEVPIRQTQRKEAVIATTVNNHRLVTGQRPLTGE